jgi:hypothetical protein
LAKYAGITTGKPSFAVRENLCRAFSIGRTAKSFFVVRNAREKNSLPCVFWDAFSHSARQTFFPNVRHLVATEGEPLAPRGEGQIFFCSLPTHGKEVSLPCVFILAHGKVFSSIYVPKVPNSTAPKKFFST